MTGYLVSIEMDGIIYSGFYDIHCGVLSVEWASYKKEAEVDSPTNGEMPEKLAARILMEIVREHRAKQAYGRL